MLPARLNCDFVYEISSNLQEFEHNRDCEARNPPEEHPTISGEQRDEYIADQMLNTFHYMEEQYRTSNVERFTRNLNARDRQRIFGNEPFLKSTIQQELKTIFEEAAYVSKKYVLWGGHSIWFRMAFKFFGDQADTTCVELANVKIANVGIASATLRKVHDAETPYAFVDCKWVHLGPADEYKYEFNDAVPYKVLPRPNDFRFGAKSIAGWRCCCEHSSKEDGTDGNCLLAKAANRRRTKCGQPQRWEKVVGRYGFQESTVPQNFHWAGYESDYMYFTARYGWLDDSSNPRCGIPAFDAESQSRAVSISRAPLGDQVLYVNAVNINLPPP